MIKSAVADTVVAAPKLPLAGPETPIQRASEPLERPTSLQPAPAESPSAIGSNGFSHNAPRGPAPQHAAPRPTNSSWQRSAAAPTPANGDRRTLHLSLGSPTHPPHQTHNNGGDTQNGGNLAHNGIAPNGNAHAAAPDGGRDQPAAPQSEPSRSASHPQPILRADAEPSHRKDAAAAFIDQELRTRVEGDITAFLAAFDAALVEDTMESRSALREATDRLLRAGARTRIELERLEARMPLPPRDHGGRNQPAWRDR